MLLDQLDEAVLKYAAKHGAPPRSIKLFSPFFEQLRAETKAALRYTENPYSPSIYKVTLTGGIKINVALGRTVLPHEPPNCRTCFVLRNYT